MLRATGGAAIEAVATMGHGPDYAVVQLQGGPLDGTLAQAPLRTDGSSVPVDIIGLPVPVLDEGTETFSWPFSM